MRTGGATHEGTARFRARFPRAVQAGHFRRLGRFWVSSIGLGTYLGEPTDDVDSAYEDAIVEAIALGCNVFDTAISYRHQRSERAIGRALRRAFDSGLASRDEIVVCSKAGFLPFDTDLPEDPVAYRRQRFVESGLIAEEELVAGGHCLAPAFLADQLARSLENLGFETIDLLYLHNPETQLEEQAEEQVMERIGTAFSVLEQGIERGDLGAYGVSTWEGFRLPVGAPGRLDLAKLVEIAGDGLLAVQAPLNLAMPEALASPTQQIGDVVVPVSVVARHLGLALVASASILQGGVGELSPEIHAVFPGIEDDTLRALQFTRSLPGLTTALVGMSSVEHVRANLSLAELPPASAEQIQGFFGG